MQDYGFEYQKTEIVIKVIGVEQDISASRYHSNR